MGLRWAVWQGTVELTAAAGCLLKALKCIVVLFFPPFSAFLFTQFCIFNLGSTRLVRKCGWDCSTAIHKRRTACFPGTVVYLDSRSVQQSCIPYNLRDTHEIHLSAPFVNQKISIMEDNWAPTPPVRQRWPPLNPIYFASHQYPLGNSFSCSSQVL